MAFSGSEDEQLNLNGPSEIANVIGGSGDDDDGGGAVAESMQVEHPQQYLHPGVNVAMAAPVTSAESSTKKRRGRPRKYGLNETRLAFTRSPLSVTSPSFGVTTSSETRRSTQGRPRGTGWKQPLAPLGEWMNKSAGQACTHVIDIGPGEDVNARLLFFAHQIPRRLYVISAIGLVSAVTLTQPLGTVTYEGHYTILTLQGSCVLDRAGPRKGDITILMSGPKGQVIAGAIGGRIIAESPVKVVAFSFVHGGTSMPRNKRNRRELEEKSSSPLGAISMPDVLFRKPLL